MDHFLDSWLAAWKGHGMHTIFDRLVEEFRAWHLFEDLAEYRRIPDFPGISLPDYGNSPQPGQDLLSAPPPGMTR